MLCLGGWVGPGVPRLLGLCLFRQLLERVQFQRLLEPGWVGVHWGLG